MTVWQVIRGIGAFAIIYSMTVFNRRFIRAMFKQGRVATIKARWEERMKKAAKAKPDKAE